MNYETKKSVMKVLKIIQIISFISGLLLLSWLLIGTFREVEIYKSYGLEYPDYVFLLEAIYALLSTIYFCFFMIYISKKLKQTKEQFYAKTKTFKAFAIVSLIFSTGVGIILMFVAFTKDGNKIQEIQVPGRKKYKKQKPILDKKAKKELKTLKHQKRHGIISKENYQKKYNQLIKKQKQLD